MGAEVVHWTPLAVGAAVAVLGVLELETLRRLRAVARRLDGVDLEVQTLRVRVRALGAAGEPDGGGATPATPPAAARER